ncbi:MAG: hypothetical protein WCK88_07155 [bacterium]
MFYILPRNVKIDGAWMPVDFSKMSFFEGVNRFIDYYKSIVIGEEGKNSNREQIESMNYVWAQIFNCACCHIGDEDMRKMFLKNISNEDNKNIEH